MRRRVRVRVVRRTYRVGDHVLMTYERRAEVLPEREERPDLFSQLAALFGGRARRGAA